MKKSTIVLMVFFALTLTTKAQIPNNEFENWEAVGNSFEPVNWTASNSWDSLGTEFAVTKSTDHYPLNVGEYSIRIENNMSVFPNWAGAGVAWSGNSMNPGDPSFPIIGHPTSFCGYYKYFPENGDTVYINLVLFLNGNSVVNARISDVVTVPDWTSFCIPIPTYSSADSGKITLAAYFGDKEHNVPYGNSVLYVDNISFDNLITSVYEQQSNSSLFTLHPNPAQKFVTLNLSNSIKAESTVNIYNVAGSLIISESLKQNQQKINIQDLNNGIYFVKINSEERTEIQKLIIQR